MKGKERSAGTYSNKKEADKAWQRAEAEVAKGRVGDPGRGRQRFKDYVEETWLPNHQIEASTREAYTYSIYKHLMPEFGTMRMIDILPEHVRTWITELKNQGMKPVTIRYNKIILSAIFTTALDDQVTFIHPCRGVRTPPVPRKPLQIITPEQFDDVYHALPEGAFRLLVETEVESGLRWGELSELRVRDLNLKTRILTVSRTVVELNPRFHPEAGRFLVKDYPKDKEYRRFKLSTQIVGQLQEHISSADLTRDDLLFQMPPQDSPRARTTTVPNPDELGLTDPNEKGRTYKHGSLSGYTAGKCRCDHCRAAFALYRAARRSNGKDNPRPPRTRETDGHIPGGWFRSHIWRAALIAAELDFTPTMRDLRHAHASWLLNGGADLQVVKERLGHASIATTERYLHTLPDADETALDALARTRNRASSR
ncbi:tyrosine-type recombinase/integrase [Actinomadura welshii]|uniref:tyrosine-type recombinase/integrase n=1 Tax=Actinomadura welshii TaxID=3103817 RepID=UPI0022866A7E|nr:tyrosine-type recombinase/integrase [Actinomadura madurae]